MRRLISREGIWDNIFSYKEPKKKFFYILPSKCKIGDENRRGSAGQETIVKFENQDKGSNVKGR
ncbi:MAG: hypothetical protein C0407_04690 [Desulfobacca sp.]|nr:hypothetical protein [Desulfobacca sp.]